VNNGREVGDLDRAPADAQVPGIDRGDGESGAPSSDDVRLVIFERGIPWQEEPCTALKTVVDKTGGGVPLGFVGGKFLEGERIPAVEEVEAKMAEVLRDRARWGL